jgi:membrane fusion protein, multidrug efflux system
MLVSIGRARADQPSAATAENNVATTAKLGNSERRAPSARWVLLALAALVSMTTAGCRKQEGQMQAPPPPEVTVVEVTPRTVPVSFAYVGQTEASKEVEIRARVPGFILRRPFQEGGEVDEGDLLFQIDPRQYQADLVIARARQAEAEARLKLAQVTLERVQSAAQQGGTTQQEIDEKAAQYQEAQAQLDLARGNVANAELNLSYCTLVAPMHGRIGRSPVYEGQYVEAGASGLLASVVQTDPIYVNVNISEREVLQWEADLASGRIKLPEGGESGLRVALQLIDGTPYEHEGVFNFVDIRVDPRTGTALVRTAFPNPKQQLKPGQYVKASFVGAQRTAAITVPQKAVITQPTGQYVMLVGDSNTTELRRVVLEEWTQTDWIVEQGLSGGERVVIEGLMGLGPNREVRPSLAPASASADGAASPTTTTPAAVADGAPGAAATSN